jgi:hypothetical protein
MRKNIIVYLHLYTNSVISSLNLWELNFQIWNTVETPTPFTVFLNFKPHDDYMFSRKYIYLLLAHYTIPGFKC